MSAVHLRRIDATRNMRRFYQLDIEPDLFGGVRLVKAWGRIGTEGRSIAEFHDSEAIAADAMQKHANSKRRRGYGDFPRG
jgi:predicted DNA-binding WGR domain protein